MSFDTSKCISLDTLKSALQKKFKDNRLIIKKVIVTEPELKGEHFVSAVEEMDVTYITSDKTEKTIHLFIKYIGKNETHRAMMGPCDPTLKEISFYNIIIPAMEDFIAKETSEPIPLRFPKCIYAKYDEVQDVIILENLRKEGFRMFPTTAEGQDLPHCKLLMEALAKFHAVSFTMIKKTEYLNVTKYPFLDEKLFGEIGKAAFNQMCMDSFDSALLTLEGDEHHQETLKILRRLRNKLFDISNALVKNPGPFEVLCHGDCWNNNMLFKYNSDGNPVEIITYDMQLLHISSLTIDLAYYFYTSTNPKFRKQHLTEMLRYYYKLFTSTLKAFGINDCGFSFEEMAEDFRRRNAFILLLMATIISIRLVPKSEFTDPGAEEDSDVINKLMNSVQIVASNPKTAQVLNENLLSAYEEMKYSLENCGVEY